MQVLVFVAPRSGVGRTTLVHRLARQAETSGAGPIVLLDADPAGDLAERCAAAPRPDLIFVPWDESCAGPEFQKLKAAKGGLIFVDAPLPEQRQAQRQTLSIADLIVVVVRPREDEFALLGDVIDEIKATGKPFVFVINRAKRHGNMAAATGIALAQYGTVCPVILPEDEKVSPSLRARVFRKIKRADGEIKREEVWLYLSGQLAAQRGEPAPQPVDEPDDGPRERRLFPRQDYDIGATFTWERQVFPCRIQNISPGGLAFTTDTPVPVGTHLTLHIPYLGEFDAETVHSNSNVIGLRFVIDAWQQAGLVRDLTGLVGAGGHGGREDGGAPPGRESTDADAGEDPGAEGSGTAAKRARLRKLA